MRILVKVSGELEKEKKFYDWLDNNNNPLDKLFVICGGGSKITETLKRYNIAFHFGPAGREIRSLEGRRLALMVLEKQKKIVKKKLKERKIVATVLIPVVKRGGEILHMNGDDYAMALYPNFDKIYVVTKNPEKSFAKEYDRLEVVHL